MIMSVFVSDDFCHFVWLFWGEFMAGGYMHWPVSPEEKKKKTPGQDRVKDHFSVLPSQHLCKLN